MAAARFDSIEIGDIDRAKGVNRQKPGDNVKRRARSRERSYDRRIGMARTMTGADDRAALQVDHRNDFDRTLVALFSLTKARPDFL